MNNKLLEDILLLRRQQIWFMHDNDSAHFLIIVRHLTNCFQEKWIGRSGPIAWLPHRIKFVRLIFMRTFKKHDIHHSWYIGRPENWKLLLTNSKNLESLKVFDLQWENVSNFVLKWTKGTLNICCKLNFFFIYLSTLESREGMVT